MKKFVVLIILLFSLLWGIGYINKNEIPISQVEKSVSPTKQVLNEEKPKENLSKDITVKLESETKTDNGVDDISTFIPKGWEVLKKYGDKLAIAEGDLNKDGITDKAFVIEQSNQSEYTAPRNLLILLGNNDNTYTLSIRAEKAILLEIEGGTFGDPFEDIVIDRGSVLLKFMGGSSRWHMYYRFRYQNNGWYLIGFTQGAYEAIGDSMYCLQDDYNLITGDYIGEKLKDGKIETIKKNIGKKQLLNLKDFVANEYKMQPK